jgi:hypothetical protein
VGECHTKEQIGEYEERWQRICYELSGNEYVHRCELCARTSGVLRIPGGHYLCEVCKKRLRLRKEKNIPIIGRNMIEGSKKIHLELRHQSDPAKLHRIEVWKQVIKTDYLIELFNRYFEYTTPRR